MNQERIRSPAMRRVGNGPMGFARTHRYNIYIYTYMYIYIHIYIYIYICIYICAHTHISKLYASICSLNVIYCIIYVLCVCDQPECWCLVVISGLGANRRIVFFVSPTRPHLAQVATQESPFCFLHTPAFTL